VAGALLRQHTVQFAVNESEAIEEFIKPFGKCGGRVHGQPYTGPTCCMSGCACIIQSEDYSQCQVPGGMKKCSPEKAAEEVQIAKDHMADIKEQLPVIAKRHLGYMKDAREAKMKELKAKSLLQGKVNKGNTARQHKEAVVAEANKKKHAKEAAEKAYDDKVKEFGGLKKAVDMIKTVVETRQKREKAGKPCPGVWGVCTGDQCCATGCMCVQKGKYYAECQIPQGKTTCDLQGEEQENKKKKKALGVLTEQKADLIKKRDAARQEYADAHKASEKAIAEANKAGAAKDKANKHHQEMVSLLEEATDRAKRSRQQALLASKQVGFAQKSVDAWKDAAEGTVCTKKAKKKDTKKESTKEKKGEKDDAEGDVDDEETTV